MKEVTFCEFNMDTACVELHFSDGSMVAISTIAVENEVADSMYQRSELDWLIYNRPLEYSQLVLGGGIEEYIKGGRQSIGWRIMGIEMEQPTGQLIGGLSFYVCLIIYTYIFD